MCVCTFLIFVGQSIEFLFVGSPIRSLIWDESLLSPLFEGVFNVSWKTYVTNLSVDQWAQEASLFMGVIFALAAFSSLMLLIVEGRRVFRFIIMLGIFLLFIMTISSVKDLNYSTLLFLELSIQLSSPLLLLFSYKPDFTSERLIPYLKIIIGLTFASHGLFATGIIYLPGHFVDMTISILGVTEDTAVQFLLIVGLLDIILSLLLFFPRAAKFALMYAIFWGLITALARIIAGFEFDFVQLSLKLFLPQTIYRIPNGLTPCLLLLILSRGSLNRKSLKSSFKLIQPIIQ